MVDVEAQPAQVIVTIDRYQNFKAWCKILKPMYSGWWWYAWQNSKTHIADADKWPYKCEPIHKYKY